MKRILLTVLISLFVSGFVIAQPVVDAVRDIGFLKNQLIRAKHDTTRIILMNDLSTAYVSNAQSDSAEKYALSAIELTNKCLSKNVKPAIAEIYEIQKAKATENLGVSLYFKNTNHALDTLQVALELWKKTGNKSGVASVYSSIAEVYSAQYLHSEALDNYKKSLDLFRQIGDRKQVARAWLHIGFENRYTGNYGDALESNAKALRIAREIKDTLTITDALLANGFNYLLVEKYADALQNQQNALVVFRSMRDSAGIATTYNDIGVTYMFSGKLDEALKNHQAALSIRLNLNEMSSIGNSYGYISNILVKQKKLDEALVNSSEALKYAKLENDVRYVLDAYLLNGNINAELKNFDTALSNYATALKISEENNNRAYQAMAQTQIAGVLRLQGKNKESLAAIRSAEGLPAETDYKIRRSVYSEMSKSYVANGDYQNAFEAEVNYQQMNDSVVSAEKIEKVTKLTQQLVFENKRALQKASQDKQLSLQEAQIKREKLIRNISFSGLAIVLAFALVFFWRFRDKRKLNIALEESLIDLKATQNQLIQSEKMASLGELTAGIAHEIKNPLNFVVNFSELNNELFLEMNQEIDNGDLVEVRVFANDIKENLEKIAYHGKRADAIVRGMLQHSRSSIEIKEPTDINALCDEYLRLTYHGLRAKDKSFNAKLISNFDESIGMINIIPQDIGRVILNLLTNAFYSCNKKKESQLVEGAYEPEVAISTVNIGQFIEISVKDNGGGIPAAVVDKIFQPFYTTKPTGEGTGLGLSMSYETITKGHNGELKVETEENKGTNFIIRIPK
ncbi:tetratricopeptide repeat protein [Cryomorpha ignava]|uniref:histidine kinase n=1 Tax=Cryomorpha ignava TaxID=101383 RepID=A0A7K3WTL2_9FLAO|nr:tetratricopeptide repeat protein [Cryomorpha ignava]NEN25029.1 tetratricopeptide repeat protein [Cryomorpha ignava]